MHSTTKSHLGFLVLGGGGGGGGGRENCEACKKITMPCSMNSLAQAEMLGLVKKLSYWFLRSIY